MTKRLLSSGPPKWENLLGHLLELRKRLIYMLLALLGGFCLVYPFAPSLFGFLVRPLASLLTGEGRRLIYTGLAEAFLTYLKIGLWGGLVLASPVILSQAWLFISPGLYRQERRSFLLFLLSSPLLFLGGAALAYGVICPLAWRFFLSFEHPEALPYGILFFGGLLFSIPLVVITSQPWLGRFMIRNRLLSLPEETIPIKPLMPDNYKCNQTFQYTH
jgi:Tat protein translocase TatC